MALPNVSINVKGEALGGGTPLNDGIAGLIVPGKEVEIDVPDTGEGKAAGAKKKTKILEYKKPYKVYSLKEAQEKLRITKENNPKIYQSCEGFYAQAAEGAPLWLMVYSDGTKMEDLVDVSKDYASSLLRAAQGEIRLLGVIARPEEKDLSNTLKKANALAEGFQKEYKPLSVLFEGLYSSAENMVNLRASKYKYVSVVLGDEDKNNGAPFLSLALGRLAKIPVQRNIGRVKDGSLSEKAYLDSEEVDLISDGVLESLHDKGYIIPRRHPNLGGYYLNDDPTCSPAADDFSSIARVRVIEKARLLAHSVLLQELNEEVPVDKTSGQIDTAYAKALQSKVENQINLQMVLEGEAQGVDCSIDPAQNILSTSKLRVSLKVLPVGYSKYIEVVLSLNNPFKSN